MSRTSELGGRFIRTMRPHVSLTTRQKLLELGWDVLLHLPYHPVFRHCTFRFLFRSLQNFLNGKNFNFLVDIKNHIEKFFAKKPENFWKDGIFKLRERWRKVVEQNGTIIQKMYIEIKCAAFEFSLKIGMNFPDNPIYKNSQIDLGFMYLIL